MESKYIVYENNRTIDRIEVYIAKLYCLSLPFRMFSQLSSLKNIFGVCANYVPFILHVIGLILWLINEKGRLDFDGKNGLVKYSTLLIVYLNLSSVLMAIVIQSVYGNQGSENAFQGIAGMIIYFVQYLLMFLYNYRVLKIIPLRDINRYLHFVSVLLLLIGYFQVLVMNGIGISLYNRLNFLGMLNSPAHLPKLCLTGSEGASAGSVLGIFVFPYLLSQVLHGKRWFFIEIILWLVPLYFTFSSTAYILAGVEIALFFALLINASKDSSEGVKTLLTIILLVIISVVILLHSGVLSDNEIENIQYLLFDKASDTDNGSTVSRSIPWLVNWGAFTEYPIFGVGNGLQGYFYEKYFPDWAMHVSGSDVRIFLERSREGISNSGAFIPGLLSGYGIVGCLLILWFIWQCAKENKMLRDYSGNLYYMYILGGVGFIITGLQGDMYGMYYAWFVLSIPFLTAGEKLTNEKSSETVQSKHIR